MDNMQLIHELQQISKMTSVSHYKRDVCAVAATELSALQAENKRLNKIVCSIPTTPDSGRTVSQYDKEMSMCAYLDDLEAENEKLRAELDQVKAKQDAAISDLTYIARTYPVDLCDDLVCQYCKHYRNVNTGCPGWTENDCFEWRGQKED